VTEDKNATVVPTQENPIQSGSGLPAIVGPREPISEVLMPSLKKSKVEPRTERPRIPGYGISKSKTGMLPWGMGREDSDGLSRVLDRHGAFRWSTPCHDYLGPLVRRFGTGSKTQKARNLAKNPNCIVGTQNAAEAVILEGVADQRHVRNGDSPEVGDQ
jgi:hypothetical protein